MVVRAEGLGVLAVATLVTWSACSAGPSAPMKASSGGRDRPTREVDAGDGSRGARDGGTLLDAGEPRDEGDAALAPVAARAIDLREALGVPDPWPVGVAVDPDDGKRYVLDARSGLYLLEGDRAELVANLSELVDPLVPLDSEFTDLAACGRRRFLLTARNDGFLFDLDTRTFARHFCYVPEIVAVTIPDAGQLTGAVGCDETRIYAQPQTFDEEGFVVNSQVGLWDLETGQELRFFDLPDLRFLAGGLVAWSARHLLLVRDQEVFHFDLQSSQLSLAGALGELGIAGGDGLAYDRGTGEFLVSDGRGDRLFVVPGDEFALP